MVDSVGRSKIHGYVFPQFFRRLVRHVDAVSRMLGCLGSVAHTVIAMETLEILNCSTLKIEPGTPTRRSDITSQELSTLNLGIAEDGIADRVSEAVVADDDLHTGSDHETLA